MNAIYYPSRQRNPRALINWRCAGAAVGSLHTHSAAASPPQISLPRGEPQQRVLDSMVALVDHLDPARQVQLDLAFIVLFLIVTVVMTVVRPS